MMRIKSQSLPETDRNKQEMNAVAERSNELNPKQINIRRSNSALPQSNQEIRNAGKQARGAKRWKVLRMLTLITRRNKTGEKRKRAGTGDSSTSTCDECASLVHSPSSTTKEIHYDGKVHKITITKPNDEVLKSYNDEESTPTNDKRIIWGDATVIDSPTRKRSPENQYSISGKSLAVAVGKWKDTIRPATSPAQYESGKVPRRAGVCEELEKTVVSDGSTLHELRKDLTVYLTLDELGML